MALKMKMFDTLGMVTLVTPPSMMNPEKISFTLINLKEKEKNHIIIRRPKNVKWCRNNVKRNCYGNH